MVRLNCIGANGPQILHLRDVLNIPEATVSLISQEQIHRQGLRLWITSDGIAVGTLVLSPSLPVISFIWSI